MSDHLKQLAEALDISSNTDQLKHLERLAEESRGAVQKRIDDDARIIEDLRQTVKHHQESNRWFAPDDVPNTTRNVLCISRNTDPIIAFWFNGEWIDANDGSWRDVVAWAEIHAPKNEQDLSRREPKTK